MDPNVKNLLSLRKDHGQHRAGLSGFECHKHSLTTWSSPDGDLITVGAYGCAALKKGLSQVSFGKEARGVHDNSVQENDLAWN